MNKEMNQKRVPSVLSEQCSSSSKQNYSKKETENTKNTKIRNTKVQRNRCDSCNVNEECH